VRLGSVFDTVTPSSGRWTLHSCLMYSQPSPPPPPSVVRSACWSEIFCTVSCLHGLGCFSRSTLIRQNSSLSLPPFPLSLILYRLIGNSDHILLRFPLAQKSIEVKQYWSSFPCMQSKKPNCCYCWQVFNPLMQDFYFQGKTWLVLLLRTYGDWNETFSFEYGNAFFSHQVSHSVLLKGRYAVMG